MERKSFLLRLDPATMEVLRVWPGDDRRSLTARSSSCFAALCGMRVAFQRPKGRLGRSYIIERTDRDSSTRERAAVASEER